MKWFTSDYHLAHKAIIGHCNRPFNSVKQMEKAIISNRNALVKKDDEVWELGDITMLGPDRRLVIESKVKQLNGNKHLVLGNHDRFNAFTYVDMGYITVHTAIKIEMRGITFVLCHDPAVYDVVKKDGVLLCGHVHCLFDDLLPKSRVINVGVDVRDFKPISEDEIFKILEEKGDM